MKIQLKKELRGQFEEITVERGMTIEEIYKEIKEELPYTVLTAIAGSNSLICVHRRQT